MSSQASLCIVDRNFFSFKPSEMIIDTFLLEIFHFGKLLLLKRMPHTKTRTFVSGAILIQVHFSRHSNLHADV